MDALRRWIVLGLAAGACALWACSDPMESGFEGDVAAMDGGSDVDADGPSDTPDAAPDMAPDAPEVVDVGGDADVPGAEVPDLPPDVPDEPDLPEDRCEDVEPGPAFGEIDGACGFLDAAVLAQSEPGLFLNRIDFGDDPYDEADFCRLSEGGREVITDENAGGSSLLSEAFSFEVLARCEAATLLKTENEVVYTNPMGKLTDLLVSIDGQKVGVSVTRAVGFPRDDPYTVERARDLLEGKLEGVLASSENVSDEDRWVKQILHVVAYGEGHAESMETAWGQIDDAIRADTVVIVTLSDGEDEWLY
jgi:hypothetical protein